MLGTPANIGYMSGAHEVLLRHVYYPCLTAKIGAPYGAVRARQQRHGRCDPCVESIAKGMGWQRVHEAVTVIGAPDRAATEGVWELAATVAASLIGSFWITAWGELASIAGNTPR